MTALQPLGLEKIDLTALTCRIKKGELHLIDDLEHILQAQDLATPAGARNVTKDLIDGAIRQGHIKNPGIKTLTYNPLFWKIPPSIQEHILHEVATIKGHYSKKAGTCKDNSGLSLGADGSLTTSFTMIPHNPFFSYVMALLESRNIDHKPVFDEIFDSWDT